MSEPESDSQRGSRWSSAGGLLFVLAAIGFLVIWWKPVSSGLEQAIGRGLAAAVFVCLWLLGALLLAIGTIRTRRCGLPPLLARVPVLLGLASLGFLVWFGLHATPERMYRAAAAGNLATVERCLRRGVDADATFYELAGFGGGHTSSTALHAAAENGHQEIVEVLIGAGADLEWVSMRGRTPLDSAIEAGHLGVASAFLDRGATLGPEQVGAVGERLPSVVLALQASEYRRQYALPEMLELLLEHQANAGSFDCVRQALWMAEHQDVRDYLELASADVELARAIVFGPAEQALNLHRAEREQQGRESFEEGELLHLATKFGNTSLASALLDSGVSVDVSWQRPYGPFRPLHHAIVQGHTDMVELLLDAGADPLHVVGGWGAALHRASLAGHVDIVRLLLDRGVPVDGISSEGDPRTALFYAAQSGSLPVVDLLLELGADPSACDGQGKTPAERARQFRHPSVVERLSSQ